jgi:hypothetical protein
MSCEAGPFNGAIIPPSLLPLFTMVRGGAGGKERRENLYIRRQKNKRMQKMFSYKLPAGILSAVLKM